MATAAKSTGAASARQAAFDWQDPFQLTAQLSDEERLVQQTAAE